MIRIGLAGAGPWATLFHAPLLASSEEFEFVAVWARRPEAAQELAAQHEVRAVRSYEELLDCCDAISFAVPPDVQPGLAIAAAHAGRHLLLDKPLGRSVDEALALQEAACDVATLLLLRNRFTNAVQDFLDRCLATQVRAVVAGFVAGGVLPGSFFATPWRVAEPHALLDLGPHALDLLEAAAGSITRVAAAASGGVLHLTTRHADGASASVVLSSVTPDSPGGLRCVAVTDTGRIEMGDPDAEPVQEAIMAEFAAAIRGERTARVDVNRGVLLQRLIAAAQESLVQDRPVECPV